MSGKSFAPVSDLLHKVDYRANRHNSKALEPYGVTMYQAMSLIYIAQHQDEASVNQRAIERYTKLSNPGVTKLVTGLEKLELVERTHDPDDARSYILRTTPKGQRQSEIFQEVILETDRKLFSALSEEECCQLAALLQKVRPDTGAN